MKPMTLQPPFDRITVESGKMGGQPCIRGLRITVRRVLEILAIYRDRSELFADYPDLQEEDLQQALAYAAANLGDRVEILERSRCGALARLSLPFHLGGQRRASRDALHDRQNLR